MADYTDPMEAAIIMALKADGEFTAYIPKASVYADILPANQTWPFSRNGSVVITPFRASGLNSSHVRIKIEAFSKDMTNAAGTVILPAASNIGLIAPALAGALDGTTLPLSNGMNLRVTWVQSLASIDDDTGVPNDLIAGEQSCRTIADLRRDTDDRQMKRACEPPAPPRKSPASSTTTSPARALQRRVLA